MSELHLPWLELSILIPLVGAIGLRRESDPFQARKWCLVASGVALLCAISAWIDFDLTGAKVVEDRWHPMHFLGLSEIFSMDQLSAPLLPLTALLFFMTTLATLRTKVRRFSFAWTLLSEAILLATLCCRERWIVVVLMALATIPPAFELRARGKSTRVYVAYMALFIVLMVMGVYFVEVESDEHIHNLWALVTLLGAVFVRCGIVPFHGWMTDLFENATFGTALLFATPISGAYAACRLVLPVVPVGADWDWALRCMGQFSLFTAVYAAGMALVQREGRRFFCYLFLSHSALVLVGLEMVTPIGLTGGLCVWLSAALSLGGFGLTLRALEARRGRLSLVEFQGLYEHTPALAMCFVLTGLASVGFPGTIGFVGTEVLVDGAVETFPYIGVAVVVAAAINGIALVKAYFVLFTGTRYVSSVSLGIGRREQIAVLSLAALIVVGGLIPQPGVQSRYGAALELLDARGRNPNATADLPARESSNEASDATEEQFSDLGER